MLVLVCRQYADVYTKGRRACRIMVQLGTVNRIIKAYALIGFCVSAYALYVEISLENDPDFKPLCDLREYVKCSSAFISP